MGILDKVTSASPLLEVAQYSKCLWLCQACVSFQGGQCSLKINTLLFYEPHNQGHVHRSYNDLNAFARRAQYSHADGGGGVKPPRLTTDATGEVGNTLPDRSRPIS